MNYLKALVDKAAESSTSIAIEATQQGLLVTVIAVRGTHSVTRTTNFWIDKNETDMVGRLEEHIKAVQ